MLQSLGQLWNIMIGRKLDDFTYLLIKVPRSLWLIESKVKSPIQLRITKHREYLLTITGKFEFICNWRSSETSRANSRRWSWRRVETRNFQDITTPNAFKLTPHLDYELLFIGSFNILSQSREQWINGERNLGGLLSTQENDIFSLKI